MFDRSGRIFLTARRRPLVCGVSKGALLASLVFAGGHAAAQETASQTEAARTTEQVVVTGQRGAPRTVLESPTPIDVLGAAEIETVGRAGVLQALQTLAPSFNVPFRAGGGISTVISTGGLRGLNPDQTLVLVNGKRRHKTSLINSVSSLYNGSVPADLDQIPTSAIKQIEVLRDGAAAQYGSDAIAGVINIILNDRSEGGFISASAGRNIDREDGELYQLNGNAGLGFGSDGTLNVSFAYKKQEASNRAVPVAPTVQIYPRIGGQPDPREATVNRLITTNYGQLPQEGVTLAYNAEHSILGATAYSFGTFGKRESLLPFTVRLPNNVVTIPQIYPEGFRPTLVIDEIDYEFAFGVRGTYRGWDWDASTTIARNRAEQSSFENLNASLGPSSPTSFRVGQLESSEWVNSLDVTRLFNVGSGELQVSFGAQHRRESYVIEAGEPDSYRAGTYVIPAGQPFAGQRPAPGAQATPGFQPGDEADESRNNVAAYGELGWTPTSKLFVGVAARYENYDDSAGDTVIGKINGRYEFTDWLSVRGAVSTGFRAPGLAQQYYASSTNQFRTIGTTLTLLLIKTLPVSSPEAIALGAEPLTPETSTNYSLGFTLRPLSNLDLTVDAYRIDLEDRIAITSTLTGGPVSAILIANGLSPDLSAQYYTNAIDTQTEGLDVVATYRLDLGDYGRMRWNVAYNRNETEITNIKANPPELTALGASFVLFDRVSRSNLTTGFPKEKIVLGVNWDIGKFNLNARGVYYGSFTVEQNNPAADRSFGSKTLTDVEVSYDLTDQLTLAIGGNNVFNVYPSPNANFNANLGSGQYPGTSPFGFTGGSYYARLRYDF